MSSNSVYLGDNLKFLKKLNSNIFDLIYIDPPFFSNRNYGNFNDKWKSLDHYLDFMRERIEQIHRVLKNTGSFYLHCDYHASHYLKIICDEIFGYKKYINEIIWKRSLGSKGISNKPRKFGDNLDYILFYGKTNKYYFNIPRIKLTKQQLERDYKNIEEETGRRFSHGRLTPFNGAKSLYFKDINKTIIDSVGFGWTQETLNKKLEENPYCIYWTRNGKPRFKVYADTHLGVPVNTLWNDINLISSNSKERLNYQTQKPEKLLERIIKTSSNEGDLIADFFCGTGTTLKVAQDLNRNFVGIDSSEKAIEICKKRLNCKVYKL